MAMAYVPPGVLPVRELQPSPLVPGNVVSQVTPVLVGYARGYQTYSENVILNGTAGTALAKKGAVINDNTLPNLSFTVTKPSTFETIGPANFIITTAAGTATGDSTTTINAISYPSAPTTSVGTAAGSVPVGDYKYAVSYLVNIKQGGGTSTYESGIGTSTGTVSVSGSAQNIALSSISTGTVSAGTVVGRNIYRSKNLGTSLNPSWGPYYQIPGTATGLPTLNNNNTTSYTDTNVSLDGNSTPQPGIANGDSITVQYSYADADYWKPTLFSNFNDVVNKYGDAFDNSGAIDSEVSFAAKMAILNGATSVVIAPVAGTSLINWQDTILKLEDDEDGQLIVPLIGDTTIGTTVFGLIQTHVINMKQRNLYKTAIFGMDGTASTVTKTILRAEATAIGTDADSKGDICLVSPAKFAYYNSVNNANVYIGGQYVAAAIAGMHAGRNIAESMTRKQIAGISAVSDDRTTIDKNQDAGSGLMVVEQIPSTGSIRIRHEITTSPEDINKREFSVALQRNNMIKRVVNAIDASIIGQIYADNSAPGRVADIVNQILRGLVNAGQLTDYTGLAAKISASDPTIIEISWQYKPVYTVQYVQITFGINLSTGGVSATGGINLIL
jgi:hypothetical protein